MHHSSTHPAIPGPDGVVSLMYAEIAITTLAVAITITRLVKDVLVVCLIKGLTRENALSQKQRFELCARLTSALRSDGQPSPPDSLVVQQQRTGYPLPPPLGSHKAVAVNQTLRR